ncbi:SMP-30/gluconolactonase/LRE family protein [Sphaerisporangium aureirubrum]|uniref:SMP-30/gluconolactonase/LRE family protein n=1 Tax=Sphaerisporangium aureirubrum TaxID=1544736 RepID=A0ABW1ND79_9ACTN
MSPHTAMDTVPRWPAVVASTEVFALGECPVWDPTRDRVVWVDVDAGTVHEGRLDGDQVHCTRSHKVDQTAGAVAVSPAGDLLVAGTQALLTVTTEGARLSGPVILPPGGRRLNDGACDPAGAFLVGSMTLSEEDTPGTEVLVRVERDGGLTVLDDDLTLSNGLAWSADGTVLYSIDSIPGVIWARPYDAATGTAGPRREWLRFTDGLPDGMCVDAEDHVWVAVWGAGQVRRYAPDATLAAVVDVPAPHTTSMAFLGDRLLITTATFGLTPEQLAEYPDSGRLFLAGTGTTGLPPAYWSGAS